MSKRLTCCRSRVVAAVFGMTCTLGASALAAPGRMRTQANEGEFAAMSTREAEPGAAYSVSRPSTGIGLLVAGWVLGGLGAVNLLGLPLCYLDVYPESAREGCKIGSAVAAGVGLGIGIPLIIVGSVQRNQYKARIVKAQSLGNLQFAVRRDRAFLLYRAAF